MLKLEGEPESDVSGSRRKRRKRITAFWFTQKKKEKDYSKQRATFLVHVEKEDKDNGIQRSKPFYPSDPTFSGEPILSFKKK